MKNKLVICLALISFCVTVSSAQGIRVAYTEEAKMPEKMPTVTDNPTVTAEIQARLKAMSIKEMCLYYNRGESLYFPASDEKPQADAPMSTGGGNTIRVQTMRMGVGGSVYMDQGNERSVSQGIIADRKFIIEEPLVQPEWNITGEEQMVAGFKCRRAEDGKGAVAWFCPTIPVNGGPDIYWGLPGLIIKVEAPRKTITLTEVNLKFDSTDKIKAPDSGKKISREEFDATVEKKRKEMEAQLGPSTSGRIVIRPM